MAGHPIGSKLVTKYIGCETYYELKKRVEKREELKITAWAITQESGVLLFGDSYEGYVLMQNN